ncbi:uncharacterized protein LOC135165013 [Diachasmimorpha longicaudata]|uniref:uncharacterized protein LOC135165013 n=1 Tax=Diachasmimorpha longicaudata TaxID=58733 RepID=UPI0030B8C053
MPECIAPGCTTGATTNPEKLNCFVIPRDPELKKKWQEALKSSKPLARTQVVCEKHFRQGDIIRVRLLLGPNDQLLGVSPFPRPKLRPGAVPSRFPWIEVNDKQEEAPEGILGVKESSVRLKETENSKENRGNAITSPKPPENDDSPPTDPPQSTESPETPEEGPAITFSDILNVSIDLPLWWKKINQRNHDDLFVSFSEITFSTDKNDDGPHSFILKELIVGSNLEIRIYVLGEFLNCARHNFETKVKSKKMLEDTLSQLHKLNICKGCTMPEAVTDAKVDCQGTLRHNSCELLTKGNICKPCHSVRKRYLGRERRKRAERDKVKQNSKNVKRIKVSSSNVQKKNKRMEKRIEELVNENKNLKKWYVKLMKKCKGEIFL